MSSRTVAVDAAVGSSSVQDVGPLAGYELQRAVRHPAFLAALATVVVAWVVPWIMDRSILDVAVVNVEAMDMQIPLLLPAAGAFVGAALIGLADYRFNADEMLSVVPVSARARLLAQAAAAVGPASAVLVVTVIRLWGVSTAPGAGGRPPLVGDVLTPAALTLFAAVLATCCAHLFKSLAACATALAVLGVFTVVGAYAAYGTSAQGLMPIIQLNTFAEPPVPTSLLTRPAGLHAVYVTALAVVVLTGTVLLKHAGGRRSVAMCVIAVLVGGAAGFAQVENARENVVPSAAWTAMYLHPRSAQRCETTGRDTYCAFPAFSSRIPYWREVVTAQKGLLPAQAANVPINVRQRLSPQLGREGGTRPPLPWGAWQEDDAADGLTETIPVSTRWARPGSDEYAQEDVLAFSVLTAATLVGWTMPTDAVPRHGEVCGARGVITAWLATQSSPPVTSAYGTVKAHSSGPGLVQARIIGAADQIVIGEREVSLADALAGLPPDQVSRAVAEHWSELSSPSTDVERAAEMLGVPGAQSEPVTSVCASNS